MGTHTCFVAMRFVAMRFVIRMTNKKKHQNQTDFGMKKTKQNTENRSLKKIQKGTHGQG